MLTLVVTWTELPLVSAGLTGWIEPAGAVPRGTEREPPIGATTAEEEELAVA